ncbi:hypothetical protein B0H14DRAFT_865816 [Mycena olivaceomarginata]|nr:hypothetical protein B0H14DRAFT_865816 [Mycena olivaceomarginata]
MEMVERASSCGTPMFGSRINLTSLAEARGLAGALSAHDDLLAVTSPRPPPVQQQQQQHASSITRRIPQAPLRTQFRQLHPPAPSPVPWQPPPPSTMSPHLSLSRRSSYAHLSETVQLQSQTQTRTRTQAPTQTPQLNTLHPVPRQRERARWRAYVWVRTGKPSSAWVCERGCAGLWSETPAARARG